MPYFSRGHLAYNIARPWRMIPIFSIIWPWATPCVEYEAMPCDSMPQDHPKFKIHHSKSINAPEQLLDAPEMARTSVGKGDAERANLHYPVTWSLISRPLYVWLKLTSKYGQSRYAWKTSLFSRTGIARTLALPGGCLVPSDLEVL